MQRLTVGVSGQVSQPLAQVPKTTPLAASMYPLCLATSSQLTMGSWKNRSQAGLEPGTSPISIMVFDQPTVPAWSIIMLRQNIRIPTCKVGIIFRFRQKVCLGHGRVCMRGFSILYVQRDYIVEPSIIQHNSAYLLA